MCPAPSADDGFSVGGRGTIARLVRRDLRIGGRPRSPLGLQPYVEAHQQEEGQRASQEGQPRPQAQHGPQLLTTAVVWFRRDLRLADNPAWSAAAQAADHILALFVLDPAVLVTAGPRRRDLLLAHLGALDARLRAQGAALLVRTGDPVQVVAQVASAVRAASVHVNGDVSAYAQRRDAAVRAALGSRTELDVRWGCHVLRPGSVVAASSGSVHKVFTPFHTAWTSALDAGPLDREPAAGAADAVGVPVHPRDPALPTSLAPEVLPEPAARPSEEPGEDGAHRRLSAWLERVDDYEERRDRPSDDDGTSQLGADLHFGTLSPRHVVEVVGTVTPGRAAFVRQLAWRDWYAALFLERPTLGRSAMTAELDAVAWRSDTDEIDAWRSGSTGYPIVDAGMRQLAATGWMHGRVRMIAASFLVKDLLVDWRLGEAHFRSHLLDGDLAQNAGNWQWVAGTGPDAAPYFRVMNPTTQSRRFDPDGEYIARWVPELAELPPADRHAPWELGPLELAAAGVVLGSAADGGTYPAPIVEHASARERAIRAYSIARSRTSA